MPTMDPEINDWAQKMVETMLQPLDQHTQQHTPHGSNTTQDQTTTAADMGPTHKLFADMVQVVQKIYTTITKDAESKKQVGVVLTKARNGCFYNSVV